MLAVSTARKVSSLSRRLKPQVKINDTVYASQAVDNVGLIEIFPQTPAGDGNNQRDGNNIRLISCELRAQVFNNAIASTTFLRVMAVRDMQQIADSKMSVLDVLSVARPTSFSNTATAGRFKKLRDKTMSLSPDHPTQTWHWNIQLNVTQRYNGSLATDIQKNGIYFLMISNQATNKPTVEWIARMKYTDM